MRVVLLYVGAAVLEIAGCFAAWAWLREGRSALWLLPGAACLAGFAVLLAFSSAAHAGRAFAAYGGVYVAASLAWLAAVEGRRPDGPDLAGAGLCLLGAAVILWGPRAG